MIEDMASVTLLLFLVSGNLFVNGAWCCNCSDVRYDLRCKSLYRGSSPARMTFSLYNLFLKGIIPVMSHSMEMQSLSLKPITLISMTALVLKLTGKFREQMEKQRDTLCSVNHIPIE